jgi:6-phosphogluconolactonase
MAHDIVSPRFGKPLLLVFQTKEESCRFLADRFRALSVAHIAEKGVFSAALSGGKTPVDLYTRIAKEGPSIDWKSIHIFLVDERYVPSTDSDSNYRMIRETLLDAVPIPESNVHPIRTDVAEPKVAAELYEHELKKFFGGSAVMPELDFVLLGVGEDGHTGSLFPGSPFNPKERRLVRAVAPAKERLPRITLTLRVINSGWHVFFFVTGKSKRNVVKRLVVDSDPSLPATLVAPRKGELTIVCDREAAALVDAKHRTKQM